MSTITTEFRAPAVARPTALRAADGVIAGYIHSLAQATAKPLAEATPRPRLARLAAHAHECATGRGNCTAMRRRPALQRIPSPA